MLPQNYGKTVRVIWKCYFNIVSAWGKLTVLLNIEGEPSGMFDKIGPTSPNSLV